MPGHGWPYLAGGVSVLAGQGASIRIGARLAHQREKDVSNEEFQLGRVKAAAFWVSPVPEFNDLTAAEVLAGRPLRERVEPVTRFQQAILDEAFPSRYTRVLAQIEAPDPT